jgi:hypothetical protein
MDTVSRKLGAVQSSYDAVRAESAQGFLAGLHNSRQVPAVILLWARGVVAARLSTGGECAWEGAVQKVAVIGAGQIASVTRIIEMVSHRLIGDDEADDFVLSLARKQAVHSATGAMRALAFDAD